MKNKKRAKVNVLEGNITKGLVKLAIPIMATSFLQMAYNLIDMIWIGKIGSQSVAAVGTAGFFMWLGMAFVIMPKIGAEVLVSQATGRGDHLGAKKNARSALQLVLAFGLFYSAILIIFNKFLMGFFNIEDVLVVSLGRQYLQVIGIGIVFAFLNPVFTAIYNGYGNSSTPFKINAIGLLINIVLDPILIFGFNLGVLGAAIATITGQMTVSIIFISKIKYGDDIFSEFNLFKEISFDRIKKMIKLGIPVSLRSGLFTLIAMVVARIIANWGPVPIAVQKIGSQIESLSWMTAEGFATATSAFVGQNYGAKNFERVKKTYFRAIYIMTVIGIFVSALLLIFPREIFSIFIQEPDALAEGITYLRILSVSQVFMCLEITSSGAFNGLSKTGYPSAISIGFNLLRIPGAMFLSSAALLGLSGIWWTISLTSVLKGIAAVIGFLYLIYKTPILKKKMVDSQDLGYKVPKEVN